MRQWMCNPKILCDRHLLGEHVEHHMFVGTINKKIRIDGYIANNLIEPHSLEDRHMELVVEMQRRNMNHKSDLPYINRSYIPEKYQNHLIDRKSALDDLLSRCPDCKRRYDEIANNCKH